MPVPTGHAIETGSRKKGGLRRNEAWRMWTFLGGRPKCVRADGLDRQNKDRQSSLVRGTETGGGREREVREKHPVD
jgi:hypothetical protein